MDACYAEDNESWLGKPAVATTYIRACLSVSATSAHTHAVLALLLPLPHQANRPSPCPTSHQRRTMRTMLPRAAASTRKQQREQTRAQTPPHGWAGPTAPSPLTCLLHRLGRPHTWTEQQQLQQQQQQLARVLEC
jgi:hypothetical protein